MASKAYDEKLLAAAPVATKFELQEGYNVDLLNRPPQTPAPPAALAQSSAPASNDHSTDPEGFVKERYPKPVTPLPFWRTKRGIIILAIVAFALVAIVVGVAVGVSQKKKNKSTIHPSNNSNSTTSASGNATSPTDSWKGPPKTSLSASSTSTFGIAPDTTKPPLTTAPSTLPNFTPTSTPASSTGFQPAQAPT